MVIDEQKYVSNTLSRSMSHQNRCVLSEKIASKAQDGSGRPSRLVSPTGHRIIIGIHSLTIIFCDDAEGLAQNSYLLAHANSSGEIRLPMGAADIPIPFSRKRKRFQWQFARAASVLGDFPAAGSVLVEMRSPVDQGECLENR